MKIKKLFEGWIHTEAAPTYHGWPTVANIGHDHLAVVCSGGREGHVCPFGRVYLYSSTDGGKNWSAPEILTDGPLDDRDAGIVVAADGSLLVNYFTDIDFLDLYRKKEEEPAGWREIEQSISLADLKNEHGFFLKRYLTVEEKWSDKIPVPVNNVHGSALLADGSLLWVGKELSWTFAQASRMGSRVVAARSVDNGISWEIISAVPPVPGQSEGLWHEAHAIQSRNGTVIAQFRNQNISENQEEGTWQTQSSDNGQTWSIPRPIGYGYPSHLFNLDDGRILMTYGYRKKPYGNRFRISEDNGCNWSEEIVLSSDGESWDIGYPSTAQLSDRTLFTLWYEKRGEKASLHFLRWKLC